MRRVVNNTLARTGGDARGGGTTLQNIAPH
jgi:hypothetical protein